MRSDEGDRAGPVAVYPGHGRRRRSLLRWTASGADVTEGFVRGRVHASYLHTHWNGIPGAAAGITAAARDYLQTRVRS